MTDLALRLNLDAEEVELVVDGKVVMSSDKDVFLNWVEAVNNKNGLVDLSAEKAALELQVEELKTQIFELSKPVEEKTVEPAAPVEDKVVTPSEPVETDDSSAVE